MITIHTHATNHLYFLITKLYKIILYLGLCLRIPLRQLLYFPLKWCQNISLIFYTVHTNFHTHHYLHK